VRQSSLGTWVGATSLILASLAYVPSTGPFTPAILLTIVALVGAVVAALLSALRLAVITFFIVCATFIVASRSFDGLVRIEYLMVALAIVAVVFGILLYGQYKSQATNN
jgi:hypothetical protein